MCIRDRFIYAAECIDDTKLEFRLISLQIYYLPIHTVVVREIRSFQYSGFDHILKFTRVNFKTLNRRMHG